MQGFGKFQLKPETVITYPPIKEFVVHFKSENQETIRKVIDVRVKTTNLIIVKSEQIYVSGIHD